MNTQQTVNQQNIYIWAERLVLFLLLLLVLLNNNSINSIDWLVVFDFYRMEKRKFFLSCLPPNSFVDLHVDAKEKCSSFPDASMTRIFSSPSPFSTFDKFLLTKKTETNHWIGLEEFFFLPNWKISILNWQTVKKKYPFTNENNSWSPEGWKKNRIHLMDKNSWNVLCKKKKKCKEKLQQRPMDHTNIVLIINNYYHVHIFCLIMSIILN